MWSSDEKEPKAIAINHQLSHAQSKTIYQQMIDRRDRHVETNGRAVIGCYFRRRHKGNAEWAVAMPMQTAARSSAAPAPSSALSRKETPEAYRLPAGRTHAYGTSGFRMPAGKMAPVAYACGALAALHATPNHAVAPRDPFAAAPQLPERRVLMQRRRTVTLEPLAPPSRTSTPAARNTPTITAAVAAPAARTSPCWQRCSTTSMRWST